MFTVPPAISCFFGAGKKRQLMAGSANYGRLRQLMTYSDRIQTPENKWAGPARTGP